MAPVLVPLFTNCDTSSMILFCFAQNLSGRQNGTAIPPDSAPEAFTRTAAVTDTAEATSRESGTREPATGSARETDLPILWVDMGFDMGYVG